jgi:outer membrane lipoprotein-sorting protein
MFKQVVSKISVATVVLLAALMMVQGSALAMDVETLVKKAEAKRLEFQGKIKDMTIIQEAVSDMGQGQALTHVTLMTKGDMYRMENKTELPQGTDMAQGMGNTMTTLAISDGKEAWVISPFTGKQKLPEEEASRMKVGGYWWEPYIKDGQVTGTETVDGRKCHLVVMKNQENSPFTKLWLATDTLVQVRAELQMGQGETTMLYFSDFREVAPGFEIPYQTISKVGDKVQSTVKVTHVKVNQGLTDDLFDASKVEAPAGPNMQELMQQMQEQQLQGQQPQEQGEQQ